jgi:trafficking protein particle complex subunit 13
MSLRERGKVFLEIHIQNLTTTTLWFEKIELLPETGLVAEDAHTIALGKSSSESIALLSGPNSILQPKDVRQYLYVLTPTEERLFPPQYPPGSVIPLGRLDISWRSFFGEPGRLVTSVSLV